MKILFFANTDWYLYNFRLSLFQKLRNQGIEVVLVSPSGPYSCRFEELGFRWIGLPMKRASLNPLAEFFIIGQVAKIYRHEKPDLVHHFTIKCVVYGSIAAQIAGVANRINAVAGLGTVFANQGIKTRALRPIVCLLLKLALRGSHAQLIIQNPDDMKFFKKNKLISGDKIHLIRGSGVDGSRFLMKKPVGKMSDIRECKFLFAARLLWDKGVDYFVQAARELAKHCAAKFYIAGMPDKGNPDSVDQAYLQSCKDEGIVELLGHVNDMASLLRVMDVVVLPSIYGEGVPRILAEAAACGLPLVAFDVPGSREIIINNKNGYLIPPKNLIALVEGLKRLLWDPALRIEMGKQSRRHFESEYGQETVIEKTLDVYRTLQGGH